MEGRKIGCWYLGQFLGAGGMGAVYEARKVGSNRRAALKLLLRDKSQLQPALDVVRRLRDEARATVGINHPGLVQVLDSGEDAELGPYVVYEYVAGKTLRQNLDEKKRYLFKETVGHVARPLLGALQALHKKGVIHRDVKPENLFCMQNGDYKLGDLGLALFEGREAKTKTGTIVGTPGYIAPEQLLNPNQKPGAAADCYAAAALLIETMTGRLPFAGKSPAERITEQLKGNITVQKLRKLGVPKSAVLVLQAAMSHSPDDRPSISQMMASLNRAVEVGGKEKETILVQSATLPKTTGRTSESNWRRWFLLLTTAILVIILVAGYMSDRKIVATLTPAQRAFFSLVSGYKGESSVSTSLEFNRLLSEANKFGDFASPAIRVKWETLREKFGSGSVLWPACQGARLAGMARRKNAQKLYNKALWILRERVKKRNHGKNAHSFDIALIFRLFDLEDNPEAQSELLKESYRALPIYPIENQLSDWASSRRVQLLLLLAHSKKAAATKLSLSELQDMEAVLAVFAPFEKQLRLGEAITTLQLSGLSKELLELEKSALKLSAKATTSAKELTDVMRNQASVDVLSAKLGKGAFKDLPGIKKTRKHLIALGNDVWRVVKEHRQSCWNMYGRTVSFQCRPKLLVRHGSVFLRTLTTRRNRFDVYTAFNEDFKDWGHLFTANLCIERAKGALRRLIIRRRQLQSENSKGYWELEEAMSELGVDFVHCVYRAKKKRQPALISDLALLEKTSSPAMHAIRAFAHATYGDRDKSFTDRQTCLNLLQKHIADKKPSDDKAEAMFRAFETLWRSARLCHKSSENVKSTLQVLDWLNEVGTANAFSESEITLARVMAAINAADAQQWKSGGEWDRKRLESILVSYDGEDSELRKWINFVISGRKWPQGE